MLDKEEQERLVEIQKKKAEVEKLEKGDFDTLSECQTVQWFISLFISSTL